MPLPRLYNFFPRRVTSHRDYRRSVPFLNFVLTLNHPYPLKPFPPQCFTLSDVFFAAGPRGKTIITLNLVD